MSVTFSEDELLAAMDAARKASGLADDDVPAGAFTTRQYANRYGLSRPTAEYQLQNMAKSGVLATGFKTVADSGNRMSRVRHYWPVRQ